jgi:phosphoenolpyruvate carboxykinase (GTP)
MTSTLPALKDWVDEVAKLTQPENIHWCDGSKAEYERLVEEMCQSGTLIPLNEQDYPNCYLHRSDPSDVARVEHLTFICTENEEDAGPNNLWMNPAEAHAKVDALFDGAMKGRTMYVIPYCMGPIDSPFSRMGVEITDSPYVVANMRIMTRMGAGALERIEKEGTFIKGLHSTGDLDPERRFIMHFPEELSINSIGSGYVGNALLGKKCHALRIASWQARTEGWLAEHMLIVGIENPQGETHYLACAFPSACGKTNLAMLIPPGHRLAASRRRGRAARHQSRGRLFWRRAGNECQDQPERVRHDHERHDFYERRDDCRQSTVVGRQEGRLSSDRLAGQRL